jgi:hypothetical protein
MLDKALGDDLRHCLGGLKPCQLTAAGKAKRERRYDFTRIGGESLSSASWHPRTIAEERERSKNKRPRGMSA